MQPFQFSYRQTWPYGGYESYDLVVVANTHAEALGMVLEKYNLTKPEHWTGYDIDLTAPQILEISHREN